MDFLAIYGVEVVVSGLGIEITPLIRYLATDMITVSFSFFLNQSGEKKGVMIFNPTEKITRGRGFTTFAIPGDLNEKIRIVAEINGKKAIYEFFYKQGEVYPAF